MEAVRRAAGNGGSVLVVHEPVFAEMLRRALLENGAESVTVGTWFTPVRSLVRDGDVRFREEAEFARFVEQGGFSCVIADAALRKAAPRYPGVWLDVPHFAVSGER